MRPKGLRNVYQYINRVYMPGEDQQSEVFASSDERRQPANKELKLKLTISRIYESTPQGKCF